MSRNMIELESLTERLVFSDVKKTAFFELETKNGKIIGFTLFKNDSVAIVRSFAEKGTFIDMHRHPGKEWFGIYTGKVKVELESGETIILNAGQQTELPADQKHSCLYLEASWGWIITMPPDNFPEKP